MGRVGGNPGNKGGTGAPGYGKQNFVIEKVKKFCPDWWEKWEAIMNNPNAKTEEIRFAMQEFNKLQVKMMPTMIAGDDDKPITIKFNGVFNAAHETKKDNNKS